MLLGWLLRFLLYLLSLLMVSMLMLNLLRVHLLLMLMVMMGRLVLLLLLLLLGWLWPALDKVPARSTVGIHHRVVLVGFHRSGHRLNGRSRPTGRAHSRVNTVR